MQLDRTFFENKRETHRHCNCHQSTMWHKHCTDTEQTSEHCCRYRSRFAVETSAYVLTGLLDSVRRSLRMLTVSGSAWARAGRGTRGPRPNCLIWAQAEVGHYANFDPATGKTRRRVGLSMSVITRCFLWSPCRFSICNLLTVQMT